MGSCYLELFENQIANIEIYFLYLIFVFTHIIIRLIQPLYL